MSLGGAAWRGDDAFVDALEKVVRHQMEVPNSFKHPLIPLRRLIGIYGHAESTKTDALRLYCDTHRIAISCEVTFSRAIPASKAIQRINAFASLLLERNGPHLIVLDHADVMAFEPDGQDTIEFALGLRRFAEDHDLIVVATMDRTLMHVKGSPEFQDYRTLFFEQFQEAGIYYPPPNTPFIARFLRACVEEFVRYYATQRSYAEYPPVAITLTDEQYILLADMCKCAATGQILKYLRSIFYEVYSPKPPSLCIGANELTLSMQLFASAPYINSGNGFPHILHYGLKEQCAGEDYFSTQAVGAPSEYGSSAYAARTSSSETSTTHGAATHKKRVRFEDDEVDPTIIQEPPAETENKCGE